VFILRFSEFFPWFFDHAMTFDSRPAAAAWRCPVKPTHNGAAYATAGLAESLNLPCKELL
jgi:hypothetical protein